MVQIVLEYFQSITRKYNCDLQLQLLGKYAVKKYTGTELIFIVTLKI